MCIRDRINVYEGNKTVEPFLDYNFATSYTVSYTHLDVYKRQAQMKVIEKYLPAQLSPEELEAEMKKIIAEAGAETMKDLGKVMGIASKAFAGKSDGKSISEMAKILLS